MLALLIIGIIAGLVGLGMWIIRKRPGEDKEDSPPGVAGISVMVVAAIMVACSLIFSTFTTIPAGHRGVVIQFSAVTGRIMEEGLQTKVPFIQSVVKMSVQTFKYEVDATAASMDLQDVNTTIALNYRLDPGQAAEVYRTLGMEYIERIAAPAMQETVKRVTARYVAEDLILRRDEVSNDIHDDLTTRLLSRGIIVEAISITNFQFSSTFTASIESKVAAEQAVLEALNRLERVKVEAQQREEQAIGEANARIAQAEGEAEYIRLVTDAQVAANTAIAESLSPAILQYILLDRLGDNINVMVIPSDQDLGLVLPGAAAE